MGTKQNTNETNEVDRTNEVRQKAKENFKSEPVAKSCDLRHIPVSAKYGKIVFVRTEAKDAFF